MIKDVESITVNRSASEVFDFLANPVNVPQWSAIVTRSLLVAALVLGYAGSYAAAQKIMPPTTPADITPPAGNSAFLVGHAVGTQGYVCLCTSTGASWTVIGSRPEATLSASSSGQDFEITHFLSPDTNPNSSAPTPPFRQPDVAELAGWQRSVGKGAASTSCLRFRRELSQYRRDSLPLTADNRVETRAFWRWGLEPNHLHPTLKHQRGIGSGYRLLRLHRRG